MNFCNILKLVQELIVLFKASHRIQNHRVIIEIQRSIIYLYKKQMSHILKQLISFVVSNKWKDQMATN